MAEKNENEVFDGAETSQEDKTPDENLTAPGNMPGQAETPGQGTDKPPIENPAPGIAETPPPKLPRVMWLSPQTS